LVQIQSFNDLIQICKLNGYFCRLVLKYLFLKYSQFILLLLTFSLQSCFLFEKAPPPVPPVVEEKISFANVPDEYPIGSREINEASGIVASRSIIDGIWVQEDGDNPSELHLIDRTGIYQGKISLPFQNRDWEDIAFGKDPTSQKNYIYMGDIGDNVARYSSYFVYRFLEPTTTLSDQVNSVERFEFKYVGAPLNSYDAETLLVDPATGDIYILTKRELNVLVFKLAYPQSTNAINSADFLGTIPYPGIQGGDISADGKEILLKNQYSVYYWKLKENESIYQALSRSRDLSPSYSPEPQGEAIAFDIDQKGFFTLSEKPYGTDQVSLRYYGKVKADN
jgi:hypothetical protein